MIRALAAAPQSRWKPLKVSRKKKDALLDLAARIAAIAERARAGSVAWAEEARAERRKPLKLGLELIGKGAGRDEIEDRLAALEGQASADPGSELEIRLVLDGLRGILDGEHPSVLTRRMAAHLGFEYFDKATEIILARLKRRRYKPDALIVPGDAPDVIRSLAIEPRNLERALRATGRDIAAAVFAGCPQESLDLAKPLFGRIGGASLEDDSAQLRGRLSGEEIAQAQAAFIDLVRSLEERGEVELGSLDDPAGDPAFVDEFTKALLEVDERVLRAAFKDIDGSTLAVAMQGMEPAAHDRILGVLSKRDERRVLDAIDGSNPLPRQAVRDAGRDIAERLLAVQARHGSASRAVVERLERVRRWED